MKIIYSIEELKREIKLLKNKKLSIGLVPTMGALHEGHGNLIKRAREDNDVAVVSIFVNPLQFDSREDLINYPRTLEIDSNFVEAVGGDIIFAPASKEMYPEELYTHVNIEKLDSNLCGASRKGHFKGVCTVVNKLFNIVSPNRAYFGKKDYQQLAIIKKMVKDLNIDIEVIGCETVRSKEGLALSSRNFLLSPLEKERALNIIRALKAIEEVFINGERRSYILISIAKKIIESVEGLKIDYVDIVDKEKLEKIDYIDKNSVIAMAVYVGNIRLIDNKELIVEEEV
jgi:pantoate--beta-alanine ligase